MKIITFEREFRLTYTQSSVDYFFSPHRGLLTSQIALQKLRLGNNFYRAVLRTGECGTGGSEKRREGVSVCVSFMTLDLLDVFLFLADFLSCVKYVLFSSSQEGVCEDQQTGPGGETDAWTLNMVILQLMWLAILRLNFFFITLDYRSAQSRRSQRRSRANFPRAYYNEQHRQFWQCPTSMWHTSLSVVILLSNMANNEVRRCTCWVR